MSALDGSPRTAIADSTNTIEPPASAGERAPKLLAGGGILAAFGVAACCVAPFALFMLGVSGAWIGNLTALKPYQPIFLAFGAASIGYGFYLVYRKPKAVWEGGSYCASPRSFQITKVGLWAATVMVVAALGFPYAVRYFLDT